MIRSLLFLFLLTGCIRQPLVVYTDYINREDLASFYVNSPDPALNNPDVGQRLIISWSLPWEFHDREDLELDYTIRFHNHEEVHYAAPLEQKFGYTLYFLKNADFFSSGGFSTYKVEIRGSEGILYEWIHPLWVELIMIGSKEEGGE